MAGELGEVELREPAEEGVGREVNAGGATTIVSSSLRRFSDVRLTPASFVVGSSTSAISCRRSLRPCAATTGGVGGRSLARGLGRPSSAWA